MSYFMVDVETDGPIPGDFSMVSIGVVLVDRKLETVFYDTLKPISCYWREEDLKVNGFTREQTLRFTTEPCEVMKNLERWICETSKGYPMFISDNNGFDWQFVNWYFHHFAGTNPFGYSSTNLGSLYKGVVRNVYKNFKHLRTTNHTHNALDDAKGNAEAFIKIIDEYSLAIKL